MKLSLPKILFITILLLHTNAYAQWTQTTGAHYAKVQLGGTVGSNAFGLDGELVPVDEFSVYTLNLYGELGITEGTTLVAAAGAGRAALEEEDTFYLNPVMIGVSNQLYRSDHFAVASLVRVGFNAGINDTDLSKNPLYEFRSATEPAFIGESMLQTGINFDNFFSTLSAGARYHSAYGLDIISMLSLGYSFDIGLVPSLSLNYNHSIVQPTIINVMGTGPTRYVGLTLGLGWWINEQIGLLIELASAPSAISNAGAPILGLSVQLR